jgi:hypothetical protein
MLKAETEAGYAEEAQLRHFNHTLRHGTSRYNVDYLVLPSRRISQ